MIVRTQGDRAAETPVEQLEGEGWFTAALERALLEGRADIAVHQRQGLAQPARPRASGVGVPGAGRLPDGLVTRGGGGLETIPDGATVGTSSSRRAALLRGLRPDLRAVPLRGNVDTRLAKLDRGEVERSSSPVPDSIGSAGEIASPSGSTPGCSFRRPVRGRSPLRALPAERGGFLGAPSTTVPPGSRRRPKGGPRRPGGGCLLPPRGMGAAGGRPPGGDRRSGPGWGDSACRGGGEPRCARGAGETAGRRAAMTGGGRPLEGRRVLVTRAAAQAGPLAQHLRQLGAEVVEIPVIAIQSVAGPDELRAAARRLRERPRPAGWPSPAPTPPSASLRCSCPATWPGSGLPRSVRWSRALRDVGVNVELVAPGTGATALSEGLLAARRCGEWLGVDPGRGGAKRAGQPPAKRWR